MKCRRPPSSPSLAATWHYACCADCRAHRHVDELVFEQARLLRIQARRTNSSRRPRGFAFLATGAAMASLAAFVVLEIQPEKPTRRPLILVTFPRHAVPSASTVEGSRAVARKTTPPAPLTVPKGIGGLAEKPTDDLEFLNPKGLDWSADERNLKEGLIRNLREDFVAPPESLVAFEGSPEELAEEWARQAAIVDDRLARNVTFASKQDSLDEICKSLSSQTGVSVSASRAVADDNLTLLIKKRSAREVMRSVTKLMGYLWRREGDAGAYRYTLEESDDSRREEARIRNEDVSSAVSRVLDASRRSTDPSATNVAVRALLKTLSVGEFQALRNGDEVVLSGNPNSARALDPATTTSILDSIGRLTRIADGDYLLTGGGGAAPSTLPGAALRIGFRMTVGEFGGVNMNALAEVSVTSDDGKRPGGKWNFAVPIASVPGVGETKPVNAETNADLAGTKLLQPKTKISPAVFERRKLGEIAVAEEPTEVVSTFGWARITRFQAPERYTTAADVWKSIHEATGIDIVADGFTRLLPYTEREGSTFDILNRYSDDMNVRWRLSEGTVFARSTTFAWQRLNEVPKRFVARLRKSSGLQVDDMVAIANLTDRQLEAGQVGKSIFHRDGIVGWCLVSRPWLQGYAISNVHRRIGRALATVPKSVLYKLASEPVPLAGLVGDSFEKLEAFGPWTQPPTHVALDLVPPDTYFWIGQGPGHPGLGIFAPTADALRTNLRRQGLDPAKGTIVKTHGHLALEFFDGEGKLVKRVGDERTYITLAKQG